MLFRSSRIKGIVEGLVPADRPAEFAEALMDLGATVCMPKKAACDLCPLSLMCAAQGESDPARYPIKPKKKERPLRRGHVYVLFDRSGGVMTERRPDKGLLGGMLGLPGSDWVEGERPQTAHPVAADWGDIGEVRHVFTHFSLELIVWRARIDRGKGLWTPHGEAANGLPSVFAKALKLAVD